MKYFYIVILCISLLNLNKLSAQTEPAPQAQQITYPKIVGYFSFILPLASVNNTGTTVDFTDRVTNIGFPTGVNVLYGPHFGFSFEFTPNIKFQPTTSAMNSLLFDPGPMFRFPKGFTFIPRLAFQTNGRYGFTPVFNQIIAHTKAANYFIAGSLPARFGNGEDGQIGVSFQFGLIFN